MAKKRAKQTSIGFLLWIALILLLVVIILFNRETIGGVLNEVRAEIAQQKPEEHSTASATADLSVKPEKPGTPKRENSTPNQTEPEKTTAPKSTPLPTVKEKNEPAKLVSPENRTIKEPAKPEQLPQDSKLRKFKVYYLRPDDSSPLKVQGLERQVTFTHSPLKATLNALFEGIKASEFNRFPDMISSIPQGSAIQSIAVKNGVAFISLNPAFTHNPFSREGLEASLKQIVFTATEFPTVNSVQILIDGKKQEYLGAEGGYIGSPLQRGSFR